MRSASPGTTCASHQLGGECDAERFPRLKTIWIEFGVAWLPFLIQRLDNEYMMRTSDCPALKKKPSDYIRDTYFTAADGDGRQP